MINYLAHWEQILIQSRSSIVSELKDLNIMILFEPGRSIVGDCGILVSRVQYVKESDEKNFLILHKVVPLKSYYDKLLRKVY